MTKQAEILFKRMARLLAVVLIVGLVVPATALAETRLAEPKPSFETPRKVMLQLTSRDPKTMNRILHNVVNIQKFYGQDNVRVAVIAYSDGLHALYEKSSPVLDRIRSLLQYDVEFVACGNTLTATKRKSDELVPGVKVVTAGIPEIVERTLNGWVYIRP